jgi:hypothetical protein
MAPRPRWWHMLQASKNEARLAVDLYNRSGAQRQLEAFIVHMVLGWTKLFQAHTERLGNDLYERDENGWRRKHPEGGHLYKPLRTLMAETFTQNDPRVANIDFFIRLRNQIEHRHESQIAALVAGRTQALLLNYEKTLVELFGSQEALGSELRFPLFLSSITEDAVAAVKRLRASVPRGVLEWIQDYESTLDPAIVDAQTYDFRIYLVPHTGAKSTADAAMTFVRADELTEEQKAVLDQFVTIVREKNVPVEDFNGILPGEVVKRVAAKLGAKRFDLHVHHQCWVSFGARPKGSADNKAQTRAEFCRFNQAFNQYVYSPQWVDYLIRRLADDDTYAAVRATSVA